MSNLLYDLPNRGGNLTRLHNGNQHVMLSAYKYTNFSVNNETGSNFQGRRFGRTLLISSWTKILKSSHISTKFAVVTNCCNLTLRTFTGKAQIKTKAPAVVVADTADVTLFNSTSSDSWKISSSNQPIRSFAFNPDSRTSSGIMQRSATVPKRTLSSCLNKEVDRQSSSQTLVNANYITQNSSGVDHKRLKILHKSGTGSSYSFDAKASAVSGRKQWPELTLSSLPSIC